MTFTKIIRKIKYNQRELNEKLTLYNSRIFNNGLDILCIRIINGIGKYLNYFENNEKKT